MTEEELQAIEAAAQAVVNNPAARNADERRAAARELRLCAALREVWDRIALLEEYPLIELTVQMPIVDEPPHRNRFAEFYRRGGGQ